MTRLVATCIRRWRLGAGIAATALGLLVAGAWRAADGAPELAAPVIRGSLTATLLVSGTLKPIQVVTYRSPLVGREAEVVALVAEGTMVAEGDLVARLDTTAVEVELERARQEARQAEADLQVAEIDRDEADATAATTTDGEGALTVDEAQARLHAAERRAERLREEHAQLAPLLARGFITREELRKTQDALDAAEEDLSLTRRRTQVLLSVTRPREIQRTKLQRAQKAAQVEQARTRVSEVHARVAALETLVQSGSLYARRPGLVVHEELLTANPRRKVRVGDRVTASQGLLTIPEVDRMLLETSVSESEVRRVAPGQRALIHVEAFPGLAVEGTVKHVGTLARPTPDRAFDDKRFDVQIELTSVRPELRPEMSARADVVVAERRQVLLAPVTAVFNTAQGLVVHAVQARRTETRRVEIGESDGVYVELVSGAHEGDRLRVVAPDLAATTSTTSTGGSTALPARP